MLTFYYDDYRVHIQDTGRVDYVRLDDVPAIPVVVTDPPAAVMAVAAAVLPLIMSDVMKADLRVERIKKELWAATDIVLDADNAEYRAASEARTAEKERVALSKQLKAAEGALQLARVSAVSQSDESLQPDTSWREQYNRNNQ